MIAVGGEDCLFIAVVTDAAGKAYEYDPRLVSAVAPLTKKVNTAISSSLKKTKRASLSISSF